MRRRMLGRRGGGGWLRYTHPVSQRARSIFSTEFKVGRTKCPSDYSRPRGKWPQGPSTHPILCLNTLVCWLHHGLHLAAVWIPILVLMPHPLQLSAGAVCSLCGASLFISMLCSPVNFHRQTEAEGVEVIVVCIIAILPLIEQ